MGFSMARHEHRHNMDNHFIPISKKKIKKEKETMANSAHMKFISRNLPFYLIKLIQTLYIMKLIHSYL
jgi:hypothetical protein